MILRGRYEFKKQVSDLPTLIYSFDLHPTLKNTEQAIKYKTNNLVWINAYTVNINNAFDAGAGTIITYDFVGVETPSEIAYEYYSWYNQNFRFLDFGEEVRVDFINYETNKISEQQAQKLVEQWLSENLIKVHTPYTLGGYQVIDLEHRDNRDDIGMVYNGVYNEIDKTRKAIVLSNILLDGVEYGNTYVELTKEGSAYTGKLYDYDITIDELDVIKFKYTKLKSLEGTQWLLNEELIPFSILEPYRKTCRVDFTIGPQFNYPDMSNLTFTNEIYYDVDPLVDAALYKLYYDDNDVYIRSYYINQQGVDNYWDNNGIFLGDPDSRYIKFLSNVTAGDLTTKQLIEYMYANATYLGKD